MAEAIEAARLERDPRIGEPLRRVDDELATRDLCVEVAALLCGAQQRGLQGVVLRVLEPRPRLDRRFGNHLAQRAVASVAVDRNVDFVETHRLAELDARSRTIQFSSSRVVRLCTTGA